MAQNKTPRWTKKSSRILEHASDLDNYNRWLISNFKSFLKGRILEVGAGLGGLARHLPQQDLVLSDLRTDYLNYLKKEFRTKTLQMDIEKEVPKKLNNKFDTILSSNVFEHINNDQTAIGNCFKLLKKGGHLLLYVPARPEIFGQLDRDMGHFRRYTKKELEQKARKAGFKIIKVRYANLPGYFTWWARGVIKTSGADSILAKIFDHLITPLLYLEMFYNPPFGQSLILIARKS